MGCACTGAETCSIRATGRHPVLVGPAWGGTAAVVVKSVPELPREQCGQAASATADTRAPALWPQGHQMAAWWRRRTSTGTVRQGKIRLFQLVSRGAKPSTSLQRPQPGTVAGLGKVAGGREEQGCSCCSPQLSNKLHILEISVRMTGAGKKKLAGMGNFPRERATVITLAVRILSLASSHQLCFIFYVLTYKEPWPAFPCIALGPPDRLEIAYHIE